jgi:ABC-type glycerol-3-phosphate transport system permease component
MASIASSRREPPRLRPTWTWLLGIPLVVWTAVSLYPLLWMISTSLKTTAEAAVSTSLWPNDALAGLQTYATVWRSLHFLHDTVNSLVISLGCITLTWVIYGLAGYALAKLQFPFRDVLFVFFMSLIFIPGVTILIPLLILLRNLNLSGTYLGIILPIVNGGGPIAMFLLRNYFRSLPHEVYESAKLDGASEFRIWAQIYMPLAIPALTFLGINGFIAGFKEWVLPLLTVQNEGMYNVPLGVYYLNNTTYIQWNVIMAGAVISLIPVVIVFFALQKYYLQGLAAGALKG